MCKFPDLQGGHVKHLKDALVDIVGQACIPLDTPYFSCRGYTSQSEMWSAAQRFIDQSYRDNCYIIHLGDHLFTKLMGLFKKGEK